MSLEQASGTGHGVPIAAVSLEQLHADGGDYGAKARLAVAPDFASAIGVFRDRPQPATIFKEEREALDKAKGVQQTIDRQAEDQRKKMDEAEKGQ